MFVAGLSIANRELLEMIKPFSHDRLQEYRSEQVQDDVNDLRLTSRAEAEPAFLEHLQHSNVGGQDLGDQLLEPGFARNPARWRKSAAPIPCP